LIPPDQLRIALAAVSQARHTHVGLRGAGAQPHAPVALLSGRSAYSFALAQEDACQLYPAASQFEVVGSDYIYPQNEGPARFMVAATPLAAYYIEDQDLRLHDDSQPGGSAGWG
jgi:hypothetical protein